MAAVISVIATANGNEADGSPVVFQFERTGNISAALSVGYRLFGTAQAGSDYTGNRTDTISFASGSAIASLSLPTLADGALIDPGETIVARIDPSESYTISLGKQLATAMITAEGMVVVPNGPTQSRWSYSEAQIGSAFAALKSDGTVVAWGGTGNAPTGLSGVVQIFSNNYAFAALKSDGTVAAWPDTIYDGKAPTGLSGVAQIFSNSRAFAALKSDGTVVAWGHTSSGGTDTAKLSGVINIFSTSLAFAALKSDGTVVAWGHTSSGGTAPAGLSDVTQIFSTGRAFAALKSDGSVVAWGDSLNRGTGPAGLSGVVGFANPFTDDRLTIFTETDQTPTISLGISPASVLEDSASNLIYTFTRTGPTTNSLFVNYSITGTADSSDYTGETQGTGKTITFAAGSSTATLTIDPTADTTVESDKTVALTLATGNGYTIGTTIAVIGIISNDDVTLPSVTLALSPTSVTEDGANNLVYTFSRSGNATNALTVNYDITGTAADSDYTGATPGSGKFITFAAGSSTETLTIDPTADTTVESDETVVLTLISGSGYMVGTNGAVTGTISNVAAALPSVSVVATANGNEADGSPVVFRFERTGDISTALSVNYQLLGTAQAGSDYTGSTSGTISFAAGSTTASISLLALADGSLIDPGETIIARINPLTNYTITPGKQFATATITAEGMVVSPKLTTGGERANIYGFAALKSDGTVVTWGSDPALLYTPTGPVSQYIPLDGESGVTQIFSNGYAFAALKRDGTVFCWGDRRNGGIGTGGFDHIGGQLSGVTQIFSTGRAFAALKSDGTVVAWGNTSYGGTAPAGLSGVTQIFSNQYAFAALKSDGTVTSWGDSRFGGIEPTGLSGVTQIFSTSAAFTALKSDGTVFCWGDGTRGGTGPTGLSGVTQIFSNYYAFAALKSDGTVTSWGDSRFGGIEPTGLSGVTQIFSNGNGYAFAALKSDGSVVAWGDNLYGGTAPAGLSDVTQIFSNGYAFAALKSDGSVVAWGSRGGTAPTGLSGVTKIFSNNFYGAFVALKSDGTVVAWGDGGYGSAPIVPAPSGLSGVTQIFSNTYAFTALKSDGTVVAWGDGGYGGTAPYELNGVVGFANPFTDDRLTTAPTYALTPSATSINEGAVLTNTVATTNVASGTKFYYALSGTGITAADFSAGALTGEGVTDATGKFSFSHTLANDLITEGAETLSIKLYSDVARTLQVGSTATVSIVESSTTPVPTYTLTPSAATINEGAVLTNTVNTTNVASGTKFYYALSGTGITTADFSAGALAEEGSTDAAGKFTFTHTLANDLTTEGAESLEINLYSDSARTLQVGSTATVSVADTSINPFNLDIDGDGKVTALGDGLMVIRKLFGAAFAGDVLTNKAISPTATRTTSEIHRFIESGISTGMLDVDKDGKTNALGDGLMVIRHLFGAAFAGAALTNKAISPDSPYFGPPANFAAVAANIDSMRPV